MAQPDQRRSTSSITVKCGRLKLKAKIAAFGSTRRPGVRAAATDPFVKMLVESETPVITIFGKSWDLHVQQVLQTSLSRRTSP